MYRRGKEFYGEKYSRALSLHKDGKSIKEISQILGISYSATYHWIKELRKPVAGNVNDFMHCVEVQGPISGLGVSKQFPKHNELFLIASRRGLSIKRLYLGKKYKQLATWYYLDGQEDLLKKHVEELENKISTARDRLKSMIDKK